MKPKILTFFLLMLSVNCLAHTIAKIRPGETEEKNEGPLDIYEVNEGSETVVRFVNPKPEKPTIREIIYYHIIENPYDGNTESQSRLEDPDFDDSVKTFTNGHSGKQFLPDNDEDNTEKTVKEHEKPRNLEILKAKGVIPNGNLKEPAKLEKPRRIQIMKPKAIIPKVHIEDNSKREPEALRSSESVSFKENTSKENSETATNEAIQEIPSTTETPGVEKKKTRKMLYDLVKEKYSRKNDSENNTISSTIRKKRSTRQSVPAGPSLPDISFKTLPPYLREHYPQHLKTTPKRSLLTDKIENTSHDVKNKMVRTFRRIKDRDENAEKAMPKTYGMDMTGSSGVVWNVFVKNFGLRYDIDMTEPVRSVKQKLTPKDEENKQNMARIFRRIKDSDENAEKAIPKTYGMDMTGNLGVVWNDFDNRPALRYGSNTELKRSVQPTPKDGENKVADDVNKKMALMFRRITDGDETGEKMPKTYGMDMTGDAGVVWNDFARPGLRYSIGDDNTKENKNKLNKEENVVENKPEKSRDIIEDEPKELPKELNTSVTKPEKTSDAIEGDSKEPPKMANSKDSADVQDIMTKLFESNTFWEWLSSWTTLSMETMAETIKKQIKDEVQKQLEAQNKEDKEEAKKVDANAKDITKEVENNKSNENTNKIEDRLGDGNKTSNDDKLPVVETTTIKNTEVEIKGNENNSKDEVKNKSSEDRDATPKIDPRNTDPTNDFDSDGLLDSIKDYLEGAGLIDGDSKTETKSPSNKTNDNKPGLPTIAARTLVGNAVGNERVTNIFIFYPTTDTNKIIEPNKLSNSVLETDNKVNFSNEGKKDENDNTKNEVVESTTPDAIRTTTTTTAPDSSSTLVISTTETSVTSAPITVSTEVSTIQTSVSSTPTSTSTQVSSNTKIPEISTSTESTTVFQIENTSASNSEISTPIISTTTSETQQRALTTSTASATSTEIPKHSTILVSTTTPSETPITSTIASLISTNNADVTTITTVTTASSNVRDSEEFKSRTSKDGVLSTTSPTLKDNDLTTKLVEPTTDKLTDQEIENMPNIDKKEELKQMDKEDTSTTIKAPVTESVANEISTEFNSQIV